MSVIGSNILAGSSGQGGYFLTNSLRFRSSASASLSRTPASGSNRTTWTWSGWVKRAEITTTERTFFGAGTDGNNFTALAWINDGLYFQNYTSGTQTITNTTAVFRDPSAWYHIVLAIDTTQGTAANRAKIYVNGVQQAGFSGTPFSSSQQFWINHTYTHRIGSRQLSSADSFSEQYMTEINFIDGQALTPSSFGETSATTGVWIPKKYTGSYGTNGFYLPFTDNSALTTSSNVGLGKDFSGNANYWTTNNISITSGSTYDSMTDVPTLTSATAGNYWTLNPLNTGQLGTIQSGNLEWIGGDQNNFRTVAAQALPTSGKYYWEVTPIGGGSGGAFVSGIYIGIMNYASGGTGLFASGARIADTGKDDYVYYSDGRKVNLNSFVSYGNSYAANDVIGIAIDIDNSKIWFSKNGTWQASGDPAAGTNAAYTTVPFSTKLYAPAMSAAEITNAQKFNFGQRPFAYTPPTGFVALNTFNLPTPTIGATASTQANDYFNVVTYTGNGADNRTISGLDFTPGLVWMKDRSNAYSHILIDAVRGNGKYLRTNGTNEENWDGNLFPNSGSTTNGFIVDGGSNVSINANGDSYVAWNWKANGAGSTNTAGSITSTVSANTSAGFSIVTYTGNGSNATIGHGLGVAPSMIIRKARNASAQNNWYVYHSSLSANGTVFLNLTDAYFASANYWNNTAPTSTVFTVGSATNVLNDTWVAYCFAQVAGYSAFGSYTGNGSSDGTFVYLGFRPRFVMIKSTVETSNWFLYDTARNTYNAIDTTLFPSASNADYVDSTYAIDVVSNGFKIRGTGQYGGYNNNGNAYVYACFAESPFKYANAR